MPTEAASQALADLRDGSQFQWYVIPLFALFAKMLPPDKSLKILGVPYRLAFTIGGSVSCVFVELLLNAAGALTWKYAW
jgi:hypothetical protein